MSGGIWLYSTRDPYNNGPACRLVWGELETFASVEAVRRTAEDLFTAAAFADVLGGLLRAGVDGWYAEQMLTGVIRNRAVPYLGHKETIQITPGGSSERRAGAVVIAKGSRRGQLSPDEARTMARHWLQAAEASEHDTLFDRVLRRAGWLGETELDAVFDLLADVRSGKVDLDQTGDPDA